MVYAFTLNGCRSGFFACFGMATCLLNPYTKTGKKEKSRRGKHRLITHYDGLIVQTRCSALALRYSFGVVIPRRCPVRFAQWFKGTLKTVSHGK